MQNLNFLRRYALEILAIAFAGYFAWIIFAGGARQDSSDIFSLSVPDFPVTHIERIHLDLTGPNHFVTLQWAGPLAAQQDRGPFQSSPGAGWGKNDCNDPVESNCPDSHCTPKGIRIVEGFMDFLKDSPVHQYVTLIDKERRIGFHSCPVVENYPASKGCVRLEPYPARLIHDNSIAGETEILIDGTWTKPLAAELGANLVSDAVSNDDKTTKGGNKR